MKLRSLTSRLSLMLSVLLLGLSSAVGLALIAVSPAGADSVTTTVSDPMEAVLPTTGIAPLTLEDTVTLPTSVVPGGEIAMEQVVQDPIGFLVAAAASEFGATAVDITAFTSQVDATDATPASISVSASNLPLTEAVSQAQAGVPLDLATAEFTAGNAGIVSLTQDEIDLTAVVDGGSLGGTTITMPMSAGQNPNVPPATLGDVWVATSTPQSQTITVTSSPPTSAAVGGSYTPTATASSGLPVLISIDPTSDACGMSDGVVYFTWSGGCIVDFSQAGNSSYFSAPEVQQSIVVAPLPKQDQTITVGTTSPASASVGGNTYSPDATATSGLPVDIEVFSLTSDYQLPPEAPQPEAAPTPVCNLDNGVVTFVGLGVCKLYIEQDGNQVYSYAAPVTIEIPVTGVTSMDAIPGAFPGGSVTDPMALAFGADYSEAVDDQVSLPTSVAPGAQIAMGQTLQLQLDPNSIATWTNSGATGLTITSFSSQVDASDATPSYLTVGMSGTPISATLSQLGSGLVIPLQAADFTAGSSGSAVFYQDAVSLQATIDGGSQSGDSFYLQMFAGQDQPYAGQPPSVLPATLGTVAVTSTVLQDQVITVTSSAPSEVGAGSTYTPAAVSTSGLTVAVTADPSAMPPGYSACHVSSGVVTFDQVGLCVLDFDQAGGGGIGAAAQVQQVVDVVSGGPIVTGGGTPTPVGPLGGVALAGVAGLGLVVAQRRRMSRSRSAS